MPEILLNRAAFTRTTGTANPTLTGDTGKSGSMSTVPTGTQVAYVRRYSSNKPGFENCIGIWRAVAAAGSIGYIERTSVELSSNDNEAVVWGVGEQTIDVTITPDMIVADDDERLLTVAPGELGTVATITGAEKWIAEQDGDGIDLTVDQVLGDPYRHAKSHALDRSRDYCFFNKMRNDYVGTTSGSLIDLNPFVLYVGGTDAKAVNGASTYFAPCVSLQTGIDSTGYAVEAHTEYPHVFVAGASDLDQRWAFIIPVLPTGAQAFTIQIGFIAGFPALATAGVYFELTEASANWFKVVKNAAGTTRVDTGIAAVAAAPTTLRVAYSASATESRFWVNGVSSLAIDDATRAVDAFTFLGMTAGIRKTNGIVMRNLVLFAHKYDNNKAAFGHFARCSPTFAAYHAATCD